MTIVSHNLHALPGRAAVFAKQESRVRSYARNFPVVFARADGVRIYDERGNAYLDFLAGAGSLNYGHNHPVLLKALVNYLQQQGITHSLDLHTSAKADFLEALESRILKPRKLSYVAQFTGPTGTNSVEAALKLARKVTGRHPVVCFTNGFHGVTLGALAMTGNAHHRGGAGLPLSGMIRMPYDGYMGTGVDTLDYFEKTLDDPSSGIDTPAAVIVETVQGEGGLNVASSAWLQKLQSICQRRKILLIVDDIQAGCGRTGAFFSFESAGIQPDFVTLSKSLSGMGLPFAITLIRRDLDIWSPGEHNGTFRGNNHAFVTAAHVLNHFWADDSFAREVQHKGELLKAGLEAICRSFPGQIQVKGRGMMLGLAFANHGFGNAISKAAFSRGLIIETSGPHDEVLKFLCPLTISEKDLALGINIVADCVSEVMLAEAADSPARKKTGQ
ncbi:MAG: diaminobutyrate--2-oxoglutarate transaminase [Steroidobacteraceae bacterium]